MAPCTPVARHTAMLRCTTPPRMSEDDSSAVRDRKSTRLNSSHEWTSYAVFCLKKKIHADGIGEACDAFDQRDVVCRKNEAHATPIDVGKHQRAQREIVRVDVALDGKRSIRRLR